jgi:hypothetical protein
MLPALLFTLRLKGVSQPGDDAKEFYAVHLGDGFAAPSSDLIHEADDTEFGPQVQ